MAGTKIRSMNDQRQYPTQKTKLSSDPITFQHNIVLDETSKDILLYNNFLKHDQMWMDTKQIELLIEEMIAFATNPDEPHNLKLSTFFSAKGIPLRVARNWFVKWPKFKEAYDFAKQIIGDRRELGALRGELSEGMVRVSMPMYDEDWKADRKEVSDLRTEQQQQAGNATFIIKKVDYSKEDK